MEIDQRQEQVLALHQERELERKGEALRDVFHEVYRSTRTISLLPMIRSIEGENRRSAEEDVVALGRMSMDAHRTVQQVYANLQHNVRVSEVYYVLDGFDPERNVPFFMYDEWIVGDPTGLDFKPSETAPTDDAPPESEDEEYRHFAQQLSWFRKHAPEFRWSNALDQIPVQLSPVLRTCDNTQFISLQQGNVRDAKGFIFGMPVYAQDSATFKGMITAVLRTNALEALLVGVPFIPVNGEDEARRVKAGWTMPAPSPFLLRQRDYGISIHDRRNAIIADESSDEAKNGRWARIALQLHPGNPWELAHFLSAADVATLVAPYRAQYRQTLIGRLALLGLMGVAGSWALLMIRRTRRELISMAHYDPLTELPNRRLFLDALARGISRSQRSHRKLALLFIDISGFNAINDAVGNRGGDQLLVDISHRLLKTVRASDTVTTSPGDEATVSRLGGDQFTVICEDIESVSGISTLIDRMQEALGEPFIIDGKTVDIAAHVGVAVFPEDAVDGDKLLTCADSAMHEARRQGSAHFIFNVALRERSDRQHKLSGELMRALERGEFQLYYQPKASLIDGSIVSLEALLRWLHPQMGMISPVEFIPILESNGAIIEVGAWVLEQSCRDLARLQQEGFGAMMISANVSVRQLRRGNLHETVARILAEYETDPARLVLEVTESMMMENLEDGRQLLVKLDELGTRLAIDDFGTGYSSLTYLQHLPLAYLKLDKSFIDGMTNPRAQHIVKSVIELAQGLSLKTIAEGIETAEQRDALARLGCDIMQGYLLSKPGPLDDILNWMRQRH